MCEAPTSPVRIGDSVGSAFHVRLEGVTFQRVDQLAGVEERRLRRDEGCVETNKMANVIIVPFSIRFMRL